MNDQYDSEINQTLGHDSVPEHGDGFFDQLEQALDADHKRSVTVLKRHWVSLVSTAGVAAVALAVLATTTLTTSNTHHTTNVAAPPAIKSSTSTTATTTPPTTTPVTQLQLSLAAQISQKVAAKYESLHSLSGTLTRTKPGEEAQVTDFKIRDDGSYWSSSGGIEQTYNAQTGALTTLHGDQSVDYSTNINDAVPPGFPISNLLSGLSLDTNPNVVETTLNGDKVWKIDAKLSKPIIGLGQVAPIGLSEIVAYFDQTSLYPVKIEAGGYTTTATNLKFNPAFTDADLVLDIPAGLQTTTYDAGAQRMSLAQAKSQSGKQILLPISLPDGFKPGPYTWNSQSGRFEVWYHDGLSEFRYTLDFSGNYPVKYGLPDPWYNLNETNADHESYSIVGGKYNGLTATIISSPATQPHATITGATTTLYIGGDITIDDMKALVNSIQAA
jgi:hypothetical protein